RIACIIGAVQGIGHAIALRLATDGCNVSVGDLPAKMSLLEELVKEIQSKGRKAIAIPVDVTKENEVDNLVSSTVTNLSRLDIMVANVGVATLGTVGPALALKMPPNSSPASIEELERVHAVNVKGTF
ncbi:hypothetical protein DFH07DRAFT_681474, partial [Mycena maculata]